jgi:hypothetical protein
MNLSNKATAILLNFKKKESLIKTIESIRRQTVPIEIILIDNSEKNECIDVDVDHLISSSRNLHCKSRFLAANWATTNYIFTLDDDVLLTDSDVIEKYIFFFEKFPIKNNTILVDRNNHYSFLTQKYPLEYNEEWSHTNFGKGRFLFFHSSYLEFVSIGYKDFVDPEDITYKTGLFGYNIRINNIVIDDLSFQNNAKWILFPNNFSAIEDQTSSHTGCQQTPGHFDFRYKWIRENSQKNLPRIDPDKTELCYLFEKWGSDKCSEYFHTYSKEYWKILNPIKDKIFHVIEIGIGSTELMADRIVPKDKYHVGASLRAWNDFFINAKIWGLDIKKEVLFQFDRINCLWTDQSNSKDLEETIKKIKFLEKNDEVLFDLIIDDGSHVVEHQINSIKTISKYLSKGGLYIIEDIRDSDIDIFRNLKIENLELVQVYNEWIEKSPGQNSFVLYRRD